MQNTRKSRKTKQYPLELLIITVIITVLLGGLAGGIMGFMAAVFITEDGSQILSWFGVSGQVADIVGAVTEPPAGSNQTKEPSSSNIPSQLTGPTKLSVEEVVEQAGPAVVSIVVTKEITQYYNRTGPLFPFDDFFFDFGSPFGFEWPQFEQPEPRTAKQRIGAGTGFIISSDGTILTNKHVANDIEAEYTVIFADGTTYDAQLLGVDAFNDLAIVKIEGNNFSIIELGDSDKIKIGETVVAIGYALGEYSNTVTTGIVSGLGRDVVTGGYGSSEILAGVIQTDAAINPGNSGGPLLNLYGEVIGINTAVNREGQLIGFAIPINTAKRVVESVEKYGRIVRPFLGVRYVMINEAIAEQNNLEVNYGALIVQGQNQIELAVMPGSPADKAGLVANDIILEMNGVKLAGDIVLAKEIVKYDPGDSITLKVYHRGEEKTVTVILAEYQD